MRNHQTKKGVTLLFAIIIASASLTVGLSVYALLSNQIRLSAIERDSVGAFYAANAGIECAVFWEFNRPYESFATSSPPHPIRCDGVDFTVGGPTCKDPQDQDISCDDPLSQGFKIEHTFFDNTCTDVYVQPRTGELTRFFRTLGQNSGCGVAGPTVVQRGYEIGI